MQLIRVHARCRNECSREEEHRLVPHTHFFTITITKEYKSFTPLQLPLEISTPEMNTPWRSSREIQQQFHSLV